MSSGAPVEMVWDGDVLRPVSPYWARRADKEFVRGEVLRITNTPERSYKSHARFFAVLNEAWKNMPPLMADRFPSPDHLRRFALIKAGYFNSQSMPCGSPAAARRMAAFVRPLDEFAIVTVDGSVVSVFTAKSMSHAEMDKATFRDASDKVLDVVAALISVSRQELSDNTGKAA